MVNGVIWHQQTARMVSVFAAIVLLTPSEVLAANQSPGQQTFGAGLFIAWAIAYLSRRRAIGGWLLYFYIQLYLSTVFSLFFLPTTLSNLRPGQWDRANLYVLYILSTVPVLVTTALEVWAATKLLFRRSEKNVAFLRKILVALMVVSAAALTIDLAYFKEAVTLYFDIVTLIFSLVWFAYFLKAKRIRLVFIENAWDHSTYVVKRVLTPEDKRRLGRRTAVASAATFVVFLLMMGLSIGDKKPDLGIFWVPLFYAAIAALIAWYLPLRKRGGTPLRDSELKGTDTR
ncbi:MAG: DUF2569 family protein [Pseudomonadota bacterium]